MRDAWREATQIPLRSVYVGNPSFYYDLLMPRSRRLDLWLTEFAWRLGKTPKLGNVTAARQAKLTKETLTLVRRYPYVRIFTWFLLDDSPSIGGWQSGLITVDGRKKPSFAVFEHLRDGQV